MIVSHTSCTEGENMIIPGLGINVKKTDLYVTLKNMHIANTSDQEITLDIYIETINNLSRVQSADGEEDVFIETYKTYIVKNLSIIEGTALSLLEHGNYIYSREANLVLKINSGTADITITYNVSKI